MASISDHLGHQFSFNYYDDGNLIRITEAGGFNADGSPLADRSWIYTYTTSDGSGPAIPNPSDWVNPDPKTPNKSTKVFSVRDPNGSNNGSETLFTYTDPPAASTAGSWPRSRTGQGTSPASPTTTSTR